MSPDRWQRLMSALNAPSSVEVFTDLVAAYSERHRHYHTGLHIDDCLAQLDEVASLAESCEEVELALWFHDAVYRTTSSKNEQTSAEWARSFLETAGATDERCHRVTEHIMATKHEAQPAGGDSILVVDVDLSILGRGREEYDRFEDNVRKEYAWVPWAIYRRKRSAILESFLSRPAIYGTEHFRNRYEERARRNLSLAIERLRGHRSGMSR